MDQVRTNNPGGAVLVAGPYEFNVWLYEGWLRL